MGERQRLENTFQELRERTGWWKSDPAKPKFAEIIAAWARKYDPNQERDERGRWSGDGGGETTRATPMTVKADRGVKQDTVASVHEALANLPAKDVERLKDVPIRIALDQTSAGIHDQGDGHSLGFYDFKRNRITIPENYDFDGEERTPIGDLRSTAVHELGHALSLMVQRDHTFGRAPGDGPIVKVGAALPQASARMTPKERDRSKYFTTDAREMIAEAYSYNHRLNPDERFFGGMTNDRVEKCFPEILKIAREM